MNIHLCRSRAAPLLMLALLSVGIAHAADDKGKDQARRMQQRVHALEQEKSQLAQAKSQLDSQLKDATDQMSKAKQGADSANRKRAALEKALKEAEGEKALLAEKLASVEQQLTEKETALTETTATLLRTQDVRRKLEAGLALRTTELSGCSTRNESLHRTGVALLKEYQEKSCLTSILQNEPLTQLKRASIENMLEDYREKLDQDRLNQQQEDRLKLMQQRLAIQKAEQEKAEKEKLEKLELVLAEQEKSDRLKARQQGDLNKMTRKLTKLFGDIEW